MKYLAVGIAVFFFGAQQGLSAPVRVQQEKEPRRERARPDDDAGVLLPIVFEGFVLDPDGAPAEGAVVVSSAGGTAVVDGNGFYRLEALVPLDAESVQLTAAGRGGRNLLASANVGVSAASGFAQVGTLLLAQGGSCSPSWLPTFGGEPGTNETVRALTVYDDGGGPALYAGGEFTTAGGVAASFIARSDGSSWSALGSGMDSWVAALTVYDDGGGPDLYAGGNFTTAGGVAASFIARWDGSSWSALGSGMNNSVNALTVHDDGSGPALYAGGSFTTAGGVAASFIARWDGSTWLALGSGMSGSVHAMTVYDDGGGPDLYAGGGSIARWDGSSWSALGGISSVRALTVYDDGGGPDLYAGGYFTTPQRIARWNGSSWGGVGIGMDDAVLALTAYDDGGGPALFAGGIFTTAFYPFPTGGIVSVAASRMARWNGSNWSALGSGVTNDACYFGCEPAAVLALTVHDDLYAGGDFTTAGGVAAKRIARWDPSWSALGSGTNDAVNALTVHDDGGGPALYEGGNFTIAGGVAASRIARRGGSSWSALGSGMNGNVFALTVHDDGGGPALYAGGDFSTAGGVAAKRIARWDGSSWSALGSGMNGNVFALTVYDDGGGPALYAGGDFTTAGGVAAKRIARWDGSSWSALGSGMSMSFDAVFALTVYDDGGGPALYAGGNFTTAGGVAAKRIARWDGSSWSALGSGMNGDVRSLTVHDDGGGPALYAGGSFTTAGGVSASRIARWDGSSWSALGSGMNGVVRALTVHDDGGGPALYAGGAFTTAGGVSANRIARWDGSSWSALGSGMNTSVFALTVHDDGGGPALYAAGGFTTAGGVPASRIARWDGSSWSALGSRSGIGGPWVSTNVNALTVHDDGGGPALYAGGNFTTAGGVAASQIARWNGSSWSTLGSGMSPFEAVYALTVYDDGGGPALYAGGDFTNAGGVAASRIARWDGSSWSALGSGISNSDGTAQVLALAVFDDGSGPALYAGGYFTTAGGVAASRIARWDGSSWSALGSGTSWTVSALTVYDDGGGPALYAGGNFTTAGGVAASRIARWDGSSWSALGSGMSMDIFDAVFALIVHDDGGGPALYAGGRFTTAGGVAASRIARWDGSSWSALGSGMNSDVHALTVHDDGSGPALYAGGFFTTAGGVAASRIARWDGSSWSALGSGMNDAVNALTVYDDGSGPALCAGGNFSIALDSHDSYLAKWGCDSTAPVITCPSPILVMDRFANGSGEIVTFTVTATDEVDPSPSIVCMPPSGSLFLPGTTVVDCTATDASGNESTCQFPVTVQRKAKPR